MPSAPSLPSQVFMSTQERADKDDAKTTNTQLVVALSCALQGVEHVRSAARAHASSLVRKVRQVA